MQFFSCRDNGKYGCFAGVRFLLVCSALRLFLSSLTPYSLVDGRLCFGEIRYLRIQVGRTSKLIIKQLYHWEKIWWLKILVFWVWAVTWSNVTAEFAAFFITVILYVKKETTDYSEILVPIYLTTRRHIPEDIVVKASYQMFVVTDSVLQWDLGSAKFLS
jgi:hypothetical protein